MFARKYLEESRFIINNFDHEEIESMVEILYHVRKAKGRLFILGNGGGSSISSHAVNDFRKICGIESYAPTDNVAELTARTNDSGFECVFSSWLRTSKINSNDAILIFSVGGGATGISSNLVKAIDCATTVGARVLGVVGRDGGYTKQNAQACVVVSIVHEDRITPHTEAFQSVVLHLLVSHPKLQRSQTKWESMDE